MPFAIVHRVSIADAKTHLVHIEMTVSSSDRLPDALVLLMPVWTPGSYLVREYARNVEALVAEPPSRATKVRKNAWRVETRGASRAVVRYRVYANELTVRTSHVDESHAFLVGASIFLCVEGARDLGARIEIDAPPHWRVATSLSPAPGSGEAARHCFDAPDFDTLVDSPIELGTHREERFDVLGKLHRYSIWPADATGDADVRRLVDDTRTILEQEARFFGGALPYDAYDLLLHLSPRSRGGLEHRACAALIAPPTSFSTREAYLDLLSLIAHECFHAWNVKRIRPEGLSPYRYEEECYTRLLWWFEGGTSYYDWRVLALTHLCTIEEYLEHLAGEIAYLDRTPGRLVHPLEDASFDAWIKLYRPDENSSNSTVSYYRKGEVVCALLDLELRARTSGRVTLDCVLAHLWQEHGARDRPVPENAMQEIFERVAGVPLGDLFDVWIRSPGELDFEPTLARVGLALDHSLRADGPSCSLGVRLRGEGGRAIVASVTRDGAAWRAGVDPGDEIIGVGGARVDGTNVDAALRGLAPGDIADIVVTRDGLIATKRATLDPPRPDRAKIVARRDAPPAARAAFTSWLGGPHPAWSSAHDGKESSQ
ncbi:MAG TPA: PDZ domain-containing protein [Polyangiaceae bacterium]|nr:PDZ domain-containing protein [Polyangiaceae bacterium]